MPWNVSYYQQQTYLLNVSVVGDDKYVIALLKDVMCVCSRIVEGSLLQ